MIKQLFKPDSYVESVYDIDAKILKEHQIGVALIDIDNTLIAYDDVGYDENVQLFVNKIKDNGIVPIFCSNNVKKRVSTFAMMYQVDYASFACKPLPFIYWHLKRKYRFKSSDVVVIGDQLLTDVLGGKIQNFKTIWVKPLIERDNTAGKITRTIENQVCRLLNIEKGMYYDNL